MPPKGWKKGPDGYEPPEGWAGDICEDCWPDGWPENSGSAACVHGEWSRVVPE